MTAATLAALSFPVALGLAFGAGVIFGVTSMENGYNRAKGLPARTYWQNVREMLRFSVTGKLDK